MAATQQDNEPTETTPLLPSPPTQPDSTRPSIPPSQSDNEQQDTNSRRNNDEPDTRAEHDPIPFGSLQLMAIMSGPYIAAFLAALDSTLVATLMSPISSTFNSPTLFSWLASSYFIANAVSQPLAGKLTDIYGRKSGMILSNVFFGLGNLVCGFARSKEMIITGRIIAGLGGGGIGPIATVLVNDLVPLRSRVLWRGVINVCFGIGSGLGGPIGGLINDKMGWRWAFLLQTPLTLIAIVLVILLQGSPSSQPLTKALENKARYLRIDFVGAMLLVIGVGIMLLGLNAAGNVVPWSHPLVLTTLPLSVVLLVGFAYYEGSVAREPIIPTKLLVHRTMFSACGANWLITAARFGLIFYAPLFFYLQGHSSTETGIRLIPESIAIGVSSIGCGFLIKHFGRYRFIANCTGIIFALGMLGPVLFTAATGIWLPLFSFTFVGIGYSGVMSITLIAMIAAVEDEYHVSLMDSNIYPLLIPCPGRNHIRIICIPQYWKHDRHHCRLYCLSKHPSASAPEKAWQC